jgi:LmbE family N-acetylglucosaminyl deacetylase
VNNLKALFLGCHCDDIELGCGATINKHKKDWSIHCSTLCSEGYKDDNLVNINGISKQSLGSLGVKNMDFQNFPPDNVSEFRQQVWEHLSKLKHCFKPDIVITQAADDHPDHVILNNESIRVFRDVTLMTYLSNPRSLRYFNADTFEVVDRKDVDAKLNCIKMYRNFYFDKFYLKDENIISSFRCNGYFVNEEFVEPYQTIIRIGLDSSLALC